MEDKYVKEALAILNISKDNPLFAKNAKGLLKLKLDTIKALFKAGYDVPVGV